MGNYYETSLPPFFMWYEPRFKPLAVNQDGYSRGDEAIERDLKGRLSLVIGADAQGIEVTSDAQIVRLKGAVASLALSRFIQNLADRTLGVRGVQNELSLSRAGASAADFTSQTTQGYPTPSLPQSDKIRGEIAPPETPAGP